MLACIVTFIFGISKKPWWWTFFVVAAAAAFSIFIGMNNNDWRAKAGVKLFDVDDAGAIIIFDLVLFFAAYGIGYAIAFIRDRASN